MLHHIKSLAVLFFAIVMLTGGYAQATDKTSISVGAGGAISLSEYKKMDATVMPLPYVHYDGERFFVKGLSAGVYAYKDSMHEFFLHAAYLPQSFDASQSDSWAMRQLDDRHSTMLGGAGYRLKTEYGIAQVTVSADVLNESNSVIVDAAYSYPITFGNVSFTPGVGGLWTNDEHNDYYYGIDTKESKKSGMKKYSADGGISPYAQVAASVTVAEQWNFFANARVTHLSEEITDSPMVSKDVIPSVAVGLSYSF